MGHTFGELLRVYVALRQIGDETINQATLADKIGVSKPTINNWMKGRYTPRDPEQIEKLAEILELTAFEHDVLLYVVNPTWVKYGTPHELLANYEINRYRERYMPLVIPEGEPPLLADIEAHWAIAFKDTFESNANHWGLGWRDDGVTHVERSIAHGCYTLRLTSKYPSLTNLGGDSLCFTPPIYYASVEARRITDGHEDDGYSLIFEEINDGFHTIFRIRDDQRKFSIFGCEVGGDLMTVYIDKTFHAAINNYPQANKLAIFANHDQHWFYINNVLVASATIPRIPHSRLDIGIHRFGVGTAVCEYRNFIVRVPPDQAFENGTPTYQ